MKNSLIKGLMVFLTMLGTTLAYSQDVSGTVSDASGPLPGASVLVKGTTKGAQTDAAGKFTIKDAGANAVLTISYIGLKTQEVNVAGRSTVKVTLQDGATELGQVVVIGYGSVKKKDATGAVEVLNSKKFDNVAAPSPAEILRGKIAGVQVTSSSGEPGAANSIRIRGTGTIRSGSEPLIVIDGVPLAGGNTGSGGADLGLGGSSAKNPLSFINQNDIESMSILKDASATAIYGARGANGIIMITTKKGKSKTPELTYGASYQFSNLATKFDVLSANRFGDLVKPHDDIAGPAAYAAAIAAGGTALEAAEAEAAARYDKGSRTYNWKDAITQSGSTMNHDLSYSSGTDKSSTRVSLGATNTEGIIKNTAMDKYTLNVFNSNDFFNGRLKLETRFGYTNIQDKRTLMSNNTGYIGNVMGAALYWNPTRPIYDANGKYTFVGDDYLNPVQLLNSYDNKSNLHKLIGSLTSVVKLTNDLKYHFVFGVEASNSVTKSQLLPSINIKDVAVTSYNGNTLRGMATVNNDDRYNKTFEHNLRYSKDFTKDIHLDAVAGYSYYSYDDSGYFASGKGYSADQKNLYDNIEGGVQTDFRAASYAGKTEYQSVFARTSWSLYNKFNLDLTFRHDGSSKAGDNVKYDNFPSVGAAYKIVDDKDGLVNNLKIRANWGKTGNTDYGRNIAYTYRQYTNNGGSTTTSSFNPDLTWESNDSYGAGLDFALISNKLSGSIDVYNRTTKNMVVAVPAAANIPSLAPLPQFVNLGGEIVNKGLEVNLNYKLVDREDFTWDVATNVAFTSNKAQNVAATYFVGALHGQGLSNAYSQIIKDGYPINSYYMYEFKGYDSNGNSQYTDVNGDVVGLGFASKKILDKQPLPKMTLGFSTAVTYKNWDASTSFYGSFGHYLYNNTNNALFYKGAFGLRNVTESVATSTQATGDPNSPSTKYLEKGDFLRMGNLTVGYTLKGDFLEKFGVKSARFYFNGSNLLLFTNYSGFDPEVDVDKSLNGIPSIGLDYFSYPKSSTYGLGLNVTF
jgi:TonB-dependent starch-binding outer membrane protein SusC